MVLIIGIFSGTTGAITNCGTQTYMAPEMFLTNGYGFTVDWWMLGMCAFEMMFGIPAHSIVNNQSKSVRHHQWIELNDSITEPSRAFISGIFHQIYILNLIYSTK